MSIGDVRNENNYSKSQNVNFKKLLWNQREVFNQYISSSIKRTPPAILKSRIEELNERWHEGCGSHAQEAVQVGYGRTGF
jgi:hypothetical protein